MAVSHPYSTLEERFEVIKEIGDGSFGSVALARVRGAGASVARRGTMVGRTVDTLPRAYTDHASGCHQDHEEDFRFIRTLS